MTQEHIEDHSGDNKYFIITPQLVWALVQDPYEFTLWSVVKMIAGDEGECYLNTEDLAALAMMSVGKTSQCRQRLLDLGLLQGGKKRDPGYRQKVWHLVIPDLWRANVEWREAHHSLKGRVGFKQRQKSERKSSLHQVKPSPPEGLTRGKPSPGEAKKNQQRTTNDLVVVALTEEQEKACDALKERDWVGTGENSARHYATIHDPDQVLRWCAHGKAEGWGAGLIRKMLDAGEPAPAPPGRRRYQLESHDPAERSPSRRQEVMDRHGIDAETMALWERAQAEIRPGMTTANYDARLAGALLLRVEDGTATIGVVNALAVDWLSGAKNAKPISQALAGLLGESVKLSFEVLG